jgi:hypothetical protein
MSKILLISITVLSLLSSCSEDLGGPTFSDANPDDLEIRVGNNSSYTLEEVEINTTSGKYNYGRVLQSTKSNYWPFSFSYPYFEVSFKVDNKEFYYQPKDYAGVDQVDNGKYSALIYEVDTAKRTFTFRLQPED